MILNHPSNAAHQDAFDKLHILHGGIDFESIAIYSGRGILGHWDQARVADDHSSSLRVCDMMIPKLSSTYQVLF